LVCEIGNTNPLLTINGLLKKIKKIGRHTSVHQSCRKDGADAPRVPHSISTYCLKKLHPYFVTYKNFYLCLGKVHPLTQTLWVIFEQTRQLSLAISPLKLFSFALQNIFSKNIRMGLKWHQMHLCIKEKEHLSC
jgi:hypothetical protein